MTRLCLTSVADRLAAAPGPHGRWRRGWALVGAAFRGLVAAATLCLPLLAGAADGPELSGFELAQDDDGVSLSYSLNLELTKSVEEALSKGVPLYFLAEAEVYRERWYWRDKRMAHATRLWRISFQPLTSTYRVTFGGLNLSYATQSEALAAMRRTVRWKVAETGQLDPGNHHYVEFSFRLDTTLLPRPLQIGISGQPDWSLSVARTQRFSVK